MAHSLSGSSRIVKFTIRYIPTTDHSRSRRFMFRSLCCSSRCFSNCISTCNLASCILAYTCSTPSNSSTNTSAQVKATTAATALYSDSPVQVNLILKSPQLLHAQLWHLLFVARSKVKVIFQAYREWFRTYLYYTKNVFSLVTGFTLKTVWFSKLF